MQPQMMISKITIIHGKGLDKVFLQTNLPCPFVPESGLTRDAVLLLECSHGYGLEYVNKWFSNVPVEVINESGM